jgi:hypothetical protein
MGARKNPPIMVAADLDPLSPNYSKPRSLTPAAYAALTVEPFEYEKLDADLDDDYARFLRGYDLGLPVSSVDSGGFSGVSVSVRGSGKYTDLLFYASSLFTRSTATISAVLRKTLKLTAPNVGAVTSGATHPRTELLSRHGPLASGRFSHTADFMQRMKFRVVQIPAGAQVVVQQLHSNTDPWCLISVDDDPMILKASLRRTEGGSGTSYTIKASLALNEWVEVILSHTGGSPNHFVNIYVNGVLVDTANATPFTQTQPCFLKAGAYYVSSGGAADVDKSVIIEYVVDEPIPNETGVFPYAYTASQARPSAITNLAVGVRTSSSIALSWSLPAANGTALTGGTVERSLNGETWATVGTPSAAATTYTDSTVSELTQYYYRVSFTNAKGTGNASNVVSAISKQS